MNELYIVLLVSSHHDVYCEYCKEGEPHELYYTHYYAAYYSRYYSNYYTDAFFVTLSAQE